MKIITGILGFLLGLSLVNGGGQSGQTCEDQNTVANKLGCKLSEVAEEIGCTKNPGNQRCFALKNIVAVMGQVYIESVYDFYNDGDRSPVSRTSLLAKRTIGMLPDETLFGIQVPATRYTSWALINLAILIREIEENPSDFPSIALETIFPSSGLNAAKFQSVIEGLINDEPEKYENLGDNPKDQILAALDQEPTDDIGGLIVWVFDFIETAGNLTGEEVYTEISQNLITEIIKAFPGPRLYPELKDFLLWVKKKTSLINPFAAKYENDPAGFIRDAIPDLVTPDDDYESVFAKAQRGDLSDYSIVEGGGQGGQNGQPFAYTYIPLRYAPLLMAVSEEDNWNWIQENDPLGLIFCLDWLTIEPRIKKAFDSIKVVAGHADAGEMFFADEIDYIYDFINNYLIAEDGLYYLLRMSNFTIFGPYLEGKLKAFVTERENTLSGQAVSITQVWKDFWVKLIDLLFTYSDENATPADEEAAELALENYLTTNGGQMVRPTFAAFFNDMIANNGTPSYELLTAYFTDINSIQAFTGSSAAVYQEILSFNPVPDGDGSEFGGIFEQLNDTAVVSNYVIFLLDVVDTDTETFGELDKGDFGGFYPYDVIANLKKVAMAVPNIPDNMVDFFDPAFEAFTGLFPVFDYPELETMQAVIEIAKGVVNGTLDIEDPVTFIPACAEIFQDNLQFTPEADQIVDILSPFLNDIQNVNISSPQDLIDFLDQPPYNTKSVIVTLIQAVEVVQNIIDKIPEVNSTYSLDTFQNIGFEEIIDVLIDFNKVLVKTFFVDKAALIDASLTSFRAYFVAASVDNNEAGANLVVDMVTNLGALIRDGLDESENEAYARTIEYIDMCVSLIKDVQSQTELEDIIKKVDNQVKVPTGTDSKAFGFGPFKMLLALLVTVIALY